LNFKLYNSPYGNLDAEVLHLTLWPPLPPKPIDYGSIHDNLSPYSSLKLLPAVFPDFYSHLNFDLYCKMAPLKDRDGNRIPSKQVLEKDPHLQAHYKLAFDLITASRCRVIILYGRPVEKWFKAKFDSSDKVFINGVEREIIFLNHPEYLHRWVTATHAAANVISLLRAHDCGIKVDESTLGEFLDKQTKFLDEQPEQNNLTASWEATKVDPNFTLHMSRLRNMAKAWETMRTQEWKDSEAGKRKHEVSLRNCK